MQATSTPSAQRVASVLEPALAAAVAVVFHADPADPLAFLAAHLGSKAAEELAKQLADRDAAIKVLRAQLASRDAQLAMSRDRICELEARLAEKGGVSRAVAAWEPFKALLGGEGAGLEAEAGKFGEGADFLEHFQFGQPDEFLRGLAGIATILRSMEEECRTNDGGKW